MPANSTHPDYDAKLLPWQRARDVVAGEDAVKAAGEKYLPRLDAQSNADYGAYKSRASFFNAVGRTLDAFIGLLFRREPVVKLPENISGARGGLKLFTSDVDLHGTTLFTYCKNVATEVLTVGRFGTLVDWNEEGDGRPYVAGYRAEDILNWRVERINGQMMLTMVVLREVLAHGHQAEGHPDDPFEPNTVEQVRVLWLNNGVYEVEVYQQDDDKNWQLVDFLVPSRLGKVLRFIPFVFHGPKSSSATPESLPLESIIFVNLDHYRLDADYKHGLHWTALPTPWVAGFDPQKDLKIGSTTAWVSDTVGAVAGFLEFKGQGLDSFVKAQDKDEAHMASLGSRMLEDTKKVGETAEALELRQGAENSVLQSMALSISASITDVLKFVVWWTGNAESPDSLPDESVCLHLNTDYTAKGMTSKELTAVVLAWTQGAISQSTLFELLRKGEVMPASRTDEEEQDLLRTQTLGGAAAPPYRNSVVQTRPGSSFKSPLPGGGNVIPGTSNIQHSTPNAQ